MFTIMPSSILSAFDMLSYLKFIIIIGNRTNNIFHFINEEIGHGYVKFLAQVYTACQDRSQDLDPCSLNGFTLNGTALSAFYMGPNNSNCLPPWRIA